MTGPSITLGKRSTGRGQFDRAVVALRDMEALVGIPQATSSRRGEKINNAELLFIFSNGSPARRQPPRPVIEPAIRAEGNRQKIARELTETAAAVVRGESKEAVRFLKRAGVAGRDASKAWFTDPRNGWAPNAPSTIRAKLGRLRGKKRKAALDAISAAGGSTAGIVVAGIDTGEMRKAITYVVRKNDASLTEVEHLARRNASKATP